MSESKSDTRTIASTVGALPSSVAERFGDHTAARYKSGGEWQDSDPRRRRHLLGQH